MWHGHVCTVCMYVCTYVSASECVGLLSWCVLNAPDHCVCAPTCTAHVPTCVPLGTSDLVHTYIICVRLYVHASVSSLRQLQ